jgi:D-xylose 1-dehydrogenase (NADP+, D-xylono-1,5-lactone-forming)
MAQRKLRLGILGAARIARTLFVPGVQAGQLAEVTAVASRDEHRARAMAAELEIPRAYASYTALLDDADIDAVYIALPNSLHAEWTIAAAKAGKHVLCEKPVASRAADAQRMALACQAAGVILMEGFMWRHHPQHARVRQLVREGAIGDPTFLRSSFTYVISPIVENAHNVRLQADLEGGSLMDVGCYGVNAARWAFEAEPVAVAGQQVVDPESQVDTAFLGALRFADRRLASIDSSFFRTPANVYAIEGSEGMLRVEKAFRPDDAPGRIHIVRANGEHRVEEVPPANQFANEVDHFARSVQAGQLLAPAEDGVAQARVIEALYTSAASGTASSLP